MFPHCGVEGDRGSERVVCSSVSEYKVGCGSCRRVVLFADCVVLFACVGRLPCVACARAFSGFLL